MADVRSDDALHAACSTLSSSPEDGAGARQPGTARHTVPAVSPSRHIVPMSFGRTPGRCGAPGLPARTGCLAGRAGVPCFMVRAHGGTRGNRLPPHPLPLPATNAVALTPHLAGAALSECSPAPHPVRAASPGGPPGRDGLRCAAHLPSRKDTGTVWRAVPGGAGVARARGGDLRATVLLPQLAGRQSTCPAR